MSQRDANLSVLFCDLDDFKHVNDDLGHDAGDTLLRMVAERLRESIRAGDTVARLGGDEFAVLVESGQDPLDLAERLVAAVHQPYSIAGTDVQTSISIGIAHYRRETSARSQSLLAAVAPNGGTGSTRTGEAVRLPSEGIIEQLLKDADVAMYRAKANGKDRAVRANTPLVREQASTLVRPESASTEKSSRW